MWTGCCQEHSEHLPEMLFLLPKGLTFLGSANQIIKCVLFTMAFSTFHSSVHPTKNWRITEK